jgi:hypothetical protein
MLLLLLLLLLPAPAFTQLLLLLPAPVFMLLRPGPHQRQRSSRDGEVEARQRGTPHVPRIAGHQTKEVTRHWTHHGTTTGTRVHGGCGDEHGGLPLLLL